MVMEYAAGRELFERICNAGRFSEDEARVFFQQLVSRVSYCHFISRILNNATDSLKKRAFFILAFILLHPTGLSGIRGFSFIFYSSEFLLAYQLFCIRGWVPY